MVGIMERRETLQCPLATARQALGLTRIDLAASSGVGYSVIAHGELGYLAEVPPSVMAVLTPFLKEVGFSSPEIFQLAFREWRNTLGEDVVRKAEKYLKTKRVYPGLDSNPRDEALSDALLGSGNGRR